MSLGLLLALVLTADVHGLATAREAFERGDYALADALASQAAQPPHEGEALYLAGLARFRAGRAEEALQAFEAAARAADPPERAQWQFNRAACLYELGRFREAEAGYLEAAEGSAELAPLALANAGFAALDEGDLETAGALAARARSAATPATGDVVRDLESQLTRARGRSLLAAGTTALDAGALSEARRLLNQAIALPLDPVDAARADALLNAASLGLAARGRGFDLAVRAGAGYDTNVLQSGAGALEFIPVATGEVASAALVGGASAAWRGRLGRGVAFEAAYVLDQLAYLASEAEDYSLQQHTLGAALEVAVGESLRVGVGGVGSLAFTGLSAFRALQWTGGGTAWAALDESDATTTRADLGFTWKEGASAEWTYLTGDRIDAGIAQQWRLSRALVEASYRYRDEAIGTLQQVTVLGAGGSCPAVTCAEDYAEPFAYTSHTLAAGTRVTLGRSLYGGALAGVEWRRYADDTVVGITPSGGVRSEVYRVRREDERFFAAAYVTYRAQGWLSLTLRYDLVVNSSTIASATYGDRNYTKQFLTLEALAAF